jgi:regulator of sirC expression with transglutaminase-like and TPR domain
VRSNPALIREQFAGLISRTAPQIPLGYAALLVAQEEYPDLDPRVYLRRLGEIARRISRRAGPGAAPEQLVDALTAELFVVEGLHGNQENY